MTGSKSAPIPNGLISLINEENSPNRNYLYLKGDGKIGAREQDGHQKGETLTWVDAYICEWDY